MKKIQKQLLIEKNIDTTWSFFDLENNEIEELISNLFQDVVENVEIVNKEENYVNTEFILDAKINKKDFKIDSKITHYRNEPFWKEVSLKLNLDEKNFFELKIELTMFEGNKERTIVKFEGGYEISSFSLKLKMLTFKFYMNNWIQQKLDDLKISIEKI